MRVALPIKFGFPPIRSKLVTAGMLGLAILCVPAWLLAGRGSPPPTPIPRIAAGSIEVSPALLPGVAPRRSLFGGATERPDQVPGNGDRVAAPDGSIGPELIGIIGRLPDDAVALVRAADGGSMTIRIGEDADGWRLAALAVDAALFVRGGERIRVGLAPAPTLSAME